MNSDWFMNYAEYAVRAIDIETHWYELRGWITKNGRHILIGDDGGGSSGGAGKSIDKSAKHDIIKLKINMFDKSDPLYMESYSIEEENGFEDVMLHGSPDSVQVTVKGKKINLDAAEFAEHLKKNGYKGGNIRLASCSTGQGDNSIAQELSKILGVKVKAPDDDVYYIPEEGIMFVGSRYSNTGKWRIFDKGVEVYD